MYNPAASRQGIYKEELFSRRKLRGIKSKEVKLTCVSVCTVKPKEVKLTSVRRAQRRVRRIVRLHIYNIRQWQPWLRCQWYRQISEYGFSIRNGGCNLEKRSVIPN